MESHLEHLSKVFAILQENNLKINLEKCDFFKTEVTILDLRLSVNGLSPIPEKVKIIANWTPPKTITQLKSFLGAVGYYKKFIKNFSMISKPLYNLLKKDVPFVWNNNCTIAFESLKEKLIRAPIFSSPDFSKPFIIRTDASLDGVGGVLLQMSDQNIEVPIYFESRTLTPAELNYSVTDLEGTTVYYCVQKFKAYITSSPFTTIVYTDHKPLIVVLHNREPTNHRHLKWVSVISSLNLNIQYQEGRKNVLADALSRIPTSFETINIINNSINNVTDANINNNISNTNSINNLMNDILKREYLKLMVWNILNKENN